MWSTLNPIKAYFLGFSDGEVMIFPNSSKTSGRCRGYLGGWAAHPLLELSGSLYQHWSVVGNACFGWQRTRCCGWKLSWHQHHRVAALRIFLEQRHKQAMGIYCGAFAASTGWNLLQIKPLTSLTILCSCRSTGVEILCSAVAASPAHTLAGLLGLILNIYWTFTLMPTTWEMPHMMGVKAKVNLFCKRLA